MPRRFDGPRRRVAVRRRSGIKVDEWLARRARTVGLSCRPGGSTLDIQPAESLRETQRGSFNITWAPIPQLELVLEFLTGRRVNKDGRKGASSQAQAGWTYRF